MLDSVQWYYRMGVLGGLVFNSIAGRWPRLACVQYYCRMAGLC